MPAVTMDSNNRNEAVRLIPITGATSEAVAPLGASTIALMASLTRRAAEAAPCARIFFLRLEPPSITFLPVH